MHGDRQRTAIVDALRAAPDGLTTAALGEAVGLHPNTVRWHLDVLAEQGMVTSAPSPPHGPGRPRSVHRVTPAAVLPAEGSVYASGLRWGRSAQAGEGAPDVARLLDRHGFAARADGDRIEMRRCPFLALAEACPEVVCTLHRGFIDGALEAAGSQRRVRKLRVLAEPALCVAELSG